MLAAHFARRATVSAVHRPLSIGTHGVCRLYSTATGSVDPNMHPPSFDSSRATTSVTVQWSPNSRYQFTGADSASIITIRFSCVSPMNLLLLALGGCASVNIRMVLAKKRIPRKVGDGNEAIEGWESVHAEFRVVMKEGAETVGEDAVRKVVDASVNKYCGVHKTLGDGVPALTWGFTVNQGK
ncbi:hypothetical protein BCR33DRAFT_715258 [Rhizoclosmatium globosum]|uniref:OsmC-like protein n=1 Tax=Rhizoclosmatium globosum TaxID=329046 RepID=A0A1Y2CJ22_9FUNG|nr:hypothetical protein BCR33DRAFT_715258 [Rhizoclosmatium globosum]|eukprot:ORY46834.1 hypothetical protein BCR33DRAFT_715258 [Rhizoclosmatium globosum]